MQPPRPPYFLSFTCFRPKGLAGPISGRNDSRALFGADARAYGWGGRHDVGTGLSNAGQGAALIARRNRAKPLGGFSQPRCGATPTSASPRTSVLAASAGERRFLVGKLIFNLFERAPSKMGDICG